MDDAAILRLASRLVELNQAKRFDQVDHSVEVATSRYVDADRWAQEKARIFAREPQLVGLGADIPAPGDYSAFELAGTPVFLVRGKDGVARGFVNSCRHRGTAIVQGRGTVAGPLMCPYHNWCYDLAGRLTGVPERAAFADAGLDTRSLIELPVAEKYGMLVMSPAPDIACDVDRFLGPAAPEFTPFGFDRVHFVKARTEELPINWKLMLEAAMEGYHVIPLHGPALDKLMGAGYVLKYFTYDRFGRHGRIVSGMRGLLDPATRASPEAAFRNMSLTNYLYPGSYLIFSGTNVTLSRTEPGSAPNKTLKTLISYSWQPLDEAGRGAAERLFDGIWQIGIDEDVWAMASAQRAFDAGFPATVIHGGVEPGVQDINAEWDAALGRN